MADNYMLEVDFKVFEKIMQGKCFYIALVNNKDRKNYKKGNFIQLFTTIYEEDGKQNKEFVNAEIVNLLYFDNVKDLTSMVGKENIGYTKSSSLDTIEDAMVLSFSNEDIEKYGLVCVQFALK